MDILTGRLLGAVLILTRVGAFWAFCPIFSAQVIPTQVKTAAAIILTIFLSGITPFPAMAQTPGAVEIVMWTAAEAMYGLAMGLVAYALFSVVRNAASIAEQQIGLTMASVLDPTTEEQEGVLTILLEMFFILLLFASQGHHVLLKILTRSYGGFGIGQIPSVGKLAESVILSGSAMLMLSLQMAAPVLAVFLLLMVVLAIMALISPETNILFLSLPIRVGLGLILLGILMPFLNEYLKQFVVWLDKLLVV
jgi:flagellar biosynthetic protein FliR